MQFMIIRGYSGSKSNVPQLTLWLVSSKSSTVWFMLSIKYKLMGVYIRRGFVSNVWAYLQKGLLLEFQRIRLNLFFQFVSNSLTYIVIPKAKKEIFQLRTN